jgi:hypothetical protein
MTKHKARDVDGHSDVYLAADVDTRVAEMEKALRASHACCCRECADEIERLLPDTVVTP